MSEVDPRAVFLARASALEILYQAGEIDLDSAFDKLVEPFLKIVGSPPYICRTCGDPTWRHDMVYCNAVGKAQAKRRQDKFKQRGKTP